MLRLALLALHLGLLLSNSARAQPWADLGPSLGLPSQLQGPSGPSLSAGITAADLDGDGHLEILVSTPTLGLVAYTKVGATYGVAPALVPAVTNGSGLFGHTLFDADHDGDLDLFVARDDKDRLYLFDSTTGTFVDRTDTHLPRVLGWSASATAVDLDGDGDLDLLLARYIDRVDFPSHRCFSNRIFLNDGRGVFTDRSPAAFAETRGCSFGIVAADYDDDLDLDLFAVNDFVQFTGRMELWENRGFTPDGTLDASLDVSASGAAASLDVSASRAAASLDLVEVSAERGLHAPVYGMGAAFEDLDQDGSPELWFTSIGEPLLFRRNTDLGFRVVNTDKNLYSRFAWDRFQATWTTRFLDLDADGHLDVLAAGGTLPAAPFIGNPPDQGAVILRGQPDGGLQPLPLAIDLPRAGHSSRDFELADLTGDGIDELLAVHIHGRISVFENLNRQGNRTRLDLRPSTTGDNAAGARLSLTCAGVTRTRRVNAGGDYGIYDRPQVDFSFPAPCETGQVANGTLRWPSGLVQTFTVTIGTTHTLLEPDWFTLTPDPTPGLPRRGTITLDLSAHAEAFDEVALVGHGLTLTPLTQTSPGIFSSTWELTDPVGGRLALTVDGVPFGFHPRIPGTNPELSFAAAPVVGRLVHLRLVFPDTTWTGTSPPTTASATLGGETTTLTPHENGLLTGALTMPSSAGPHPLVVTWPAGRLEQVVDILPPVSADESEVVVRELHILEAERLTRRVRLRARLYDANHEASAIALESLGVLIDGVPAEPDTRTIEAGFMTLGVEHSRLIDGSTLTFTIDGVSHFPPQRVVQVATPEAFGAFASPERSRCWFSEPRARADGEDVVTAIIQFADDAGTRLPDTGLSPTLTTELLRVAPGSLELGYGGWRVDLVAGTQVGLASLEVRLPGMNEGVTCTIELVAPPRLPDPSTTSTLVALSANPVVGQSIVIRAWPLGPDGRSLGSGVPLTVATSDNAEATPVAYIGQGRYQGLVTPRATGPVTVQVLRSDGAIIAATTLWEVGEEPDASPEPGPEPDPEVDEVEPEPEAVEADATEFSEPGPERDEPSPEVVEPTPDAVELEPGDTAVSEPDAIEADTVEPGSDTATEPQRSPRNEGCGSASNPTVTAMLVLFVLFGLLRLIVARGGHSRRRRDHG